jgi:hypothetical protein
MRWGLIARAEDREARVPVMRLCDVDGCGRPHNANGLCSMHGTRLRKHGTLDAHSWARPAVERFLEFVSVAADGCWLWTGTTTAKGYGMFFPGASGPRMQSAHRWAYEHYVGPIPDGLQIDHLCRNRRCVNPEHLEVVTARQNQERSPFDPAKRTHCPQGHPYDEANTYVSPNGRRNCRICARAARSAYQARKELAR